MSRSPLGSAARELPRDPEERHALVALRLRKLSDATGCPEAIEQAYRLGYRSAELARTATDGADGVTP